MTVTDVTGVTVSLSDDEYAAALERVREFKSQLARADRLSDQDTLARAVDLELLFTDPKKRWVRDLPPVVKRMHAGRPVDPESLSRFSKWVEQQTGLSGRRVYQLHRASEKVAIICTAVQIMPTGEGALRPLDRLRKIGKEDRIADVYRRAVELSEGQPPTSAEVKQAVDEFMAPFTPTRRKQLAAAEKAKTQADKLKAQFITILGADAELAGITLNEMIDLYKEQVEQ